MKAQLITCLPNGQLTADLTCNPSPLAGGGGMGTKRFQPLITGSFTWQPPLLQLLSESHPINISKDTFVALIT